MSTRLPMRVTLAAMKYDYGRKDRGLSFEYYNLYLALQEVFERVDLFDFASAYHDDGKAEMNRSLLEFVRRERPDLTIFALFQDEFVPEMIDSLRQYTTTLAYFFDDSWRQSYALFWAPHFDYFTTTSTSALRYYRDLGMTNGLFSPLGYNHTLYVRRSLPKLYDVSFVGSFHGHRDWMIRKLRKAGLNVSVWGVGWPAGRLSQDAMIDVFNQTRICLTLSNSLNLDARYLLESPRWALTDLRHCRKTKEQIKGRHFEISGCGSLQMSYYVEDLEHCYEIGKEILVFADVDDLIDKIRYYLKHQDERESIAEAGWQRAANDHSIARRFADIVEQIGGPEHLKVAAPPGAA
ncbi:MAG TPA: glycosyltransferase [Chloroflexota bacterium]